MLFLLGEVITPLMLDSGLHPAGNTLESHACMGMRHGVVKQHGNANPCAYRTALKEWLEVSEMLHAILILMRVFRVVAMFNH